MVRGVRLKKRKRTQWWECNRDMPWILIWFISQKHTFEKKDIFKALSLHKWQLGWDEEKFCCEKWCERKENELLGFLLFGFFLEILTKYFFWDFYVSLVSENLEGIFYIFFILFIEHKIYMVLTLFHCLIVSILQTKYSHKN